MNAGYPVKMAAVMVATLSLCAVNPADAVPVPINPGTATVDGDPSEWTLDIVDPPGAPYDFVAPMWRAGNPDPGFPGQEILANLYMRYDQSTETLYALVLAVEDHFVVIHSSEKGSMRDDSHIRIVNPSPPPPHLKLVDGYDEAPGTFQWVSPFTDTINGEEWLLSLGWEAAAGLAPGEWTISVHAQIFPDDTAAVEGRWIDVTTEVELDLPPVPPPATGVIPEPVTGGLALMGLASLAGYTMRRRPRPRRGQ